MKPRDTSSNPAKPPAPRRRPKWPLNQLYFYLTEGCNLRCRHCWLAPKHEEPGHLKYPALDFELLRQIVAEARPLGLTGVKLTGGEPLLHPRILDIMRHLREEEIGCTVETNGTLMTAEIAAEIAKLKRTHVAVSLDGIDAATHEWVRGVAGSFDAAVRGVKHLVAAGIHPQLILSVMKKTRPQMAEIVRWAEELGAGSVKFNIVQPTERGMQLTDSGQTLDIRELVETGAWVEGELIPQAKIRVFYHHPAAFRPLGRMFSRSGGDGCGRCGIFGILGVLGNGSYALCGIGSSVPELVFGQAGRDRLADIWRKNKVLRAIRAGVPRKLGGICGRCMMKRVCLGSCIAQNYYTTRSLWAPYWYCDEAFRAGLFPETRLFPEPPEAVSAVSPRPASRRAR